MSLVGISSYLFILSNASMQKCKRIIKYSFLIIYRWFQIDFYVHQFKQHESVLNIFLPNEHFPFDFKLFTRLSSSSTSNKSTQTADSSSEYLANDYFSYNTFSYYDIEAASTKFRLPQPSSYAPLKVPEPAPQKK